YDFAVKWIKTCYEGQDQDADLNDILRLLEKERRAAQRPIGVEAEAKAGECPRERRRAVPPLSLPLLTRLKNIVCTPKFCAIAVSLLLAAVGAALVATGVLAPLGVALGWTGLALASPSAAAAVGAIFLALPAVIGGLV